MDRLGERNGNGTALDDATAEQEPLRGAHIEHARDESRAVGVEPEQIGKVERHADRGPRGRFRSGHSVGAATRFVPENAAHRTTSVVSFQVRGETVLSPELRASLAIFSDGLTTDQGGQQELSTLRGGYIKRLLEIEGVLSLLAEDIQRRGMLTPRGRMRASYQAYMLAVDRWDRLAQRLGIERRQRAVTSFREAVEGGD